MYVLKKLRLVRENLNIDQLLIEFSRITQSTQAFCAVHLFTHREFGGSLGLAYLADPAPSKPGGICASKVKTKNGII